MLQAYCLVLLSEHRELNVAVGIALDARWTAMGSEGGSEDLLVLQVDNWTEQLVADAAKAKEDFDILRSDRLMLSDFHATNYPDRDRKMSYRKKRRQHPNRAHPMNPKKR
jgi:hypothetical protein